MRRARSALLSMEPDPPYMRPNLSKGLWKGRPVEKIWRKTEERGTELHLSRKGDKLDPQKKQIHDNKGDEYTYDKLLLATGGTPNHLPFGDGNIIYYRDFQDYQHLRALTEKGRTFCGDRRWLHRFGDRCRVDHGWQKSDNDLSRAMRSAQLFFPVIWRIS